ncbi:hypothetical protein ACTFIZ_001848 [Dictyostelium cf. discoideum]
MKIKYISIFIILIYKFLFSKSICIFMGNESRNSLVVTKLNCTKQIELITLYENKTIERSLGFQKSRPLVDISTLDIIFLIRQLGCGILKFYYNNKNGVWNFFNTKYEIGKISGEPLLDGEGSFIIKGSNLFNTSIEIIRYQNDIYTNDTQVGTINDDHTEVKFSINEARYQGQWKINVNICDTFYGGYIFRFSPELIRMEGVLNDIGGNITFTGNHLRPKHNVTGTFGNKSIKCFNTDSSKSITCTLPTRKNYGFLGYNIPLTVTIDGEYISNTIKISYDLPLIQNVQQRGNSQIFNVTGVYLSRVINITVITGMSMKTNITEKLTPILEEPGFYIESNNTIFIFLPNNTQPGFMELINNDTANAEPFRAPRFNFKITPTITDGQSFKSNTARNFYRNNRIFTFYFCSVIS